MTVVFLLRWLLERLLPVAGASSWRPARRERTARPESRWIRAAPPGCTALLHQASLHQSDPALAQEMAKDAESQARRCYTARGAAVARRRRPRHANSGAGQITRPLGAGKTVSLARCRSRLMFNATGGCASLERCTLGRSWVALAPIGTSAQTDPLEARSNASFTRRAAMLR